MHEHRSILPTNSFTSASNAKPESLVTNTDTESFQSLPIQCKLSIGAVDDPLEHEADAMADKVMRMPETSFIQRKCASCEEEEKVQRKPLASFIQKKQSSINYNNVTSDSISNQIQSTKSAGNAMTSSTKSFMESRFEADFSNVKIHTGNYASQLSNDLNAQAFTVGNSIYFNEGNYQPESDAGKHLLAHELTHTIQQSGSGNEALNTKSIEDNLNETTEKNADTFIQRAIRTNGGTQKINEKDYQTGASKQNVGSKFKVRDLLADKTQRVFKDVSEVEQYANGSTDYIGDIITQSKKAYWYRLPANDLKILGEMHQNPDGNVEDIIIGLGTKRFMYEPYHEFKELQPGGGSLGKGTGTTTTLKSNEQNYRVSTLVDYKNFSPALESIVIKAFTGAGMYNKFLGSIGDSLWDSRKTDKDYSFGERVALYFSFAFHIASDIAGYSFPAKKKNESHYIEYGRSLQAYYTANKAVLDAFSTAKDADKLIGIGDMYKTFKPAERKIYKDFADIFEKFAAGYIEELGTTSGNADLTKEGSKLFKQTTKDLDSFSPAREEIMKERIKIAKANKYLIVGMGDTHHINLESWLNANSISHEEVTASLKKQESDIAGKWVP